MTVSLDRRQILASIAATSIIGPPSVATEQGLKLGEPAPFSFERLKDAARQLAGGPYVSPPALPQEILSRIDYEAWGKIEFDIDFALFADGRGRFPITFFHVAKFFPKPVAMHVVEAGTAQEILFDPRCFTMPDDSPARQLATNGGFAGFRVHEARDSKLDWRKNDWVAFLGASYFRAIGELHQYGISARGIAIDTAVGGRPEEFPDFTKIYLAEPNDDVVIVHALLEGSSITGAFRFTLARGRGVVMDVEQALFLRRAVQRFGLAPLTSMYWFSKISKPTAVDWRPEVHDSDGLGLESGRGERIWRPLNNPPHAVVSSFADENPRGFGLMQRDRVFDHYLDGVHYESRPTLWVEPKGDWGKGAVQLIELPTDDETQDNIIAMWVSQEAAVAGSEHELEYRLHWLAEEPHPTELARCIATRLGKGGQPGKPRPPGVHKFVVEFLGGPLVKLTYGVKPEMVVETSRGHITDYKIIEAVPDDVPGHWRAEFDLADVQGADPVELRLSLLVGDKTATETWLFQYHPLKDA